MRDDADRPVRRPSVWVVVSTTITLTALAAALVVTVSPYQLTRVPPEGSADAGFTRDMMAHHAQAVEMAEILRGATDDPQMRLLASDIALTQQAQIGQMLAWLDLWGLPARGQDPPMAWMGMGVDSMTDMPGMASRNDLTELASLEGGGAERRFLELMIAHHAAGVDMAEAALDRTQARVVRQLARQIAVAQRSEMETMEGLLAARRGDSTAPVDGMADDMPDDGTEMPHDS